MPRPKKWRRVEFQPQVTYFKPAGIPGYQLEEVVLSIEEAEALRLKEVEGIEQEECARAMSISRPTFHRVLTAARHKVADAIVGGKAIRIRGGDFLPAVQSFRCANDGYQWEVPFDEMVPEASELVCPECSSAHIEPVYHSGYGRSSGWRRGRGWGRRGGRRRSG